MTHMMRSLFVCLSHFRAGGLWQIRLCVACCCAAMQLGAQTSPSVGANAVPRTNLLVMIQGTVEVLPAGTSAWKPGKLNQVLHPGDRVRTGERSRAEVYLINGMTIEKGEL